MTWDIDYKLPDGAFYPDEKNVYKAFELPLDQVRVVILGQDPYHDGSATGLAFDNPLSKKPSPSLRNILAEIISDIGVTEDGFNMALQTGSWLGHLPHQGVLLLNTALTVEPEMPGSHTKYWEPFTEKVIDQINTLDHVVWILWGNKAISFKEKINPNHSVVESGHPSPLARGAAHPFKDSKPFSKTNKILTEHGQIPIVW